MKCAGCRRPANADATRYGKLWCTECVASIEFEERLACQNRLKVADVFVDKAGQLTVLLEEAGDGPGASVDSARIALTETDVLGELVETMVAFRQNVVVLLSAAIISTERAPQCARRYLEVLNKYQSLLGPEELESTADMRRIAQRILAVPN